VRESGGEQSIAAAIGAAQEGRSAGARQLDAEEVAAMAKAATVVALIAVLVGVLGGFLWWGIPTNRLQTELHDTRASAVPR
jgi:hypothetical protein